MTSVELFGIQKIYLSQKTKYSSISQRWLFYYLDTIKEYGSKSLKPTTSYFWYKGKRNQFIIVKVKVLTADRFRGKRCSDLEAKYHKKGCSRYHYNLSILDMLKDQDGTILLFTISITTDVTKTLSNLKISRFLFIV